MAHSLSHWGKHRKMLLTSVCDAVKLLTSYRHLGDYVWTLRNFSSKQPKQVWDGTVMVWDSFMERVTSLNKATQWNESQYKSCIIKIVIPTSTIMHSHLTIQSIQNESMDTIVSNIVLVLYI